MQLFDLKLRKTRGVEWPPLSVKHNGKLQSLADVFRKVGVEFRLTLDPEWIADHPRGWSFDLSDLHGLLPDRAPSSADGTWRATALIVPSIAYLSGQRVRRPQGVMFDIGAADGSHRAREGCAIAWQLTRTHPAIYLRTLAHEVGHLLNLMHPDEDVPPIHSGNTLMFETRSLARNPTYPDNIQFEFSDTNVQWLRTAPENYVRPGGERYGSRPGQHIPVTIAPTDSELSSPVVADQARDGEALELSMRVLTSHTLPWIPIEFEVRLSAPQHLPRPFSIDLDPAAGELSIEVLTGDERWELIPAVVRDCGHPRVPFPAVGHVTQTIVLPGACLRGTERRVFRARYRNNMLEHRQFDVRSKSTIVEATSPKSAAECLVSEACAAFDMRLAVCWGGFSTRLTRSRQQLEALQRQVDLASVAPRLALALAHARWETVRSRQDIRDARHLTGSIQRARIADHQRCEAEFLDECCVHKSRFATRVH